MKVKFYLTGSGRSPIEEFLCQCSNDVRADFLDAISLLEQGVVLEMPVSRNLANIHNGLHELRLKDRSGQVRFIYYVKRGDAIYVVHAFKKKTQALPQKEIDLIRKRIREV